jgi:N-dimethylarginine dimethylaminohydrolase
MSTTSHSEFGKIKSLFIKQVTAAFISDDAMESQWRSLNYLGKPDFNKAVTEYSKFEEVLAKSGAEIHYLPASDEVTMDSIYCRDAAIATDGGMIICRMGKQGRVNEPLQERLAFERAGIRILGEIEAPGTLEGGDVAWLDQKTLAVGHTYRTNESGITQLRSLLDRIGVELIVAEMPHYRGESDVFHLMSVFSPVSENIAVVYSPLMPIKFRNELLRRGFRFVEVPEGEFDSMGCNVLAIAPGKCVMVAGNPITESRLRDAGCEVITYDGVEISVKGGGGPTCLTRPILRTL